MKVADDTRMAALACTAEGLIVARVQFDAVFVEVAHDVEVAIATCTTERLIVARA